MTPRSVPNTKSNRGKQKDAISIAREFAQVLSADQLGVILDAISDGFAAFDEQMNFTYVNKKAGELLGREPQDLIGKNYWEEYPEAKDTPFANACVRAREIQTPVVIEDHYPPFEHWFEYRIHPFKDGLAIYFSETARNRQAKQALVTSQQRIQEINETSSRLAKELTLLDKVRTSITREIDLSILLRTIVESVAESFGYSHVSLYLLNGDMLILQHHVGYEHVIPKIPLTQGVSGRVVRTGKPIYLEDIETDPEFLGAIGGIVSEICVPLLVNQEVTGILNVESTHGVKLTEADFKLMIALSEHISLAIGRGRLFSEIQHRNLFLSALQEATLAVIGRLESSDVLKAILSQAARLMNTTHGYIYLVSPNEEIIQVETGMGIFSKYIGTTLKPGEGLAGKVWETAKSLHVPNYREWSGHSDKFMNMDSHAVVGIPLIHSSRVVGVLGLAYLEPNKIFRAEDIDLLSQFAQLASIALENANLHTKVKLELAERKEAEEALRQFRKMMDESNDAIYMIDQETGRYVDCNRSGYEHLGYTREELLQLTIMDVAQHIPTIETWQERIHLVHEQTQLLLESSYRRKDGTFQPVEISAKILNMGDKPILLAVVRDITERKQSEISRQKHLDYLAALQKVTIELLDRNDVKSLLVTICEKAASLLDAKHGFIFLDDGDALLLRAATQSLAHHIDEREKKPGTGVLGQVWQSGGPVKVEYYDTWELRDPNYSGDKLRAVAGVPILRGESMIGVLVIARIEEDNRVFTDDEMDILSHFGELASLVLDNVSLYESAVNEIAERKKIEDALKKSEERYRILFEESPITLWEEDFSEAKKYLDTLLERGMTDIRSYLSANPDEISKIAGMVRVIDVNKSALKMYRTTNKEEVYRNLQQSLLPETILSFKEEIIAIAENRSYFTIESKDKVAGGEIIDISLNWTVAPDFENYSRVIVSLIDITERKRAEAIISQYAVEMERRVEERTAELTRLNTELEYANRAKSEFLANMSHELRTPLNSILGFSETLLEKRRGPLTEKQEQYIGLIYSSGEHLLSLINDVLEVSKIEAGKLDVHPDHISVKEVCESSLNFVKTTAMKKSITLEYINEQFISTIYADPQRLKQILVNLLNNAVKFTPEKGKVLLKISVNAERDQIQFSVTDTGIGIARNDLKNLFTPFTQLDSSLARQYEGTGLGLVIVYKLTELHGGSVQVESEPGKGSRFTVIFPWDEHEARDHTQGIKRPAPFEDADRATSNAIHRGIILLAEDNMANVLTIQEYLADKGYEVVVAHNGVEAIARAEEVSPNIILMDIQMPEMDGLEAIRRLRASPKFASVPIFALTALAMPGDRERVLETGANEYMSKPVSLGTLVTAIDEVLRQKE